MIFSEDELTNLTTDFSIDLTYLQEFSNGDKVFEKDMLLSSLDEAEDKMQLLNGYIANKQIDKIRTLAHSLKSMMYVIGLKNLHTCFQTLEGVQANSLADNAGLQQFDVIRQVWNVARIKIDELAKTHF